TARRRDIMNTGFPCPNPTCKHVFPSTAVKGAAALKCPLCATVFQFRSTAAQPKRPVAPAQPVPPPAPTAAVPPKLSTPRPSPTAPLARPATPPPRPAQSPAPPAAPMTALVLPDEHSQSKVRPRQTPETGTSSAFNLAAPVVTPQSARKRLGHGFPWRSIAVVAVLVAGVVGAGILVAPLLSSRSSESKTDTLGWVSREA